jgi:hypothetical protein
MAAAVETGQLPDAMRSRLDARVGRAQRRIPAWLGDGTSGHLGRGTAGSDVDPVG